MVWRRANLQILRLDREAAEEEGGDSHDPGLNAYEYDELARRLPVFCVSSRAYQKLSGRLDEDSFQVDGFSDTRATEIPQLQEHVKELTQEGRRVASLKFLNELSQLLGPMTVWAAEDNSISLNLKHKKADRAFLEDRFVVLKKVGAHPPWWPFLF